MVKTAAYIVEQLGTVSATDRMVLPGLKTGAGERRRTKIDVEISGDVAGITVHLALPYPAPLRELTRQVRTRVSEEVPRLTGIPVSWVDIRIMQLHVAPGERTLQ